jgi:integrase
MVQFSAKVSVPVSLWDTTSGRATGKSKIALSVNASLNKICVAAHSAYRDLLVKNENVSALDIKNAFQGIASEQDTLIKYYEAHIEKIFNSVGVNRCMATYKRYGIALNHLKRFMRKKYNVSDMSFPALTPSFIKDFDYYLRIDLAMAPNTIVGIVGKLKGIVKTAINNGVLRNDPFVDYEYITSPIVPKSLTSKELKKMMKAKLSKPYLSFIRDMFLFSSFTGIAFGDMRALTDKNLSIAEDGVQWVNLKRKKTGTPCHIPLMEIPLQLIEKYKGIAKDDKLFPMLSGCKTSIYLRRIAKECGIDKRVTFHMARHTYASEITLSQGVPLETVGELLGHTDWRSTRIYAQVNNDKVGKDMRNLNKRLTGKFHLGNNNSEQTTDLPLRKEDRNE